MTINTVAILGSGTMGSGIAQVCALHGLATVLYDVTPDIVNAALGRIVASIQKGVDLGKTAPEAEAFLASRGLIVRGVANYGLPGHLRITLGLEEHNRALVEALAEFLRA